MLQPDEALAPLAVEQTTEQSEAVKAFEHEDAVEEGTDEVDKVVGAGELADGLDDGSFSSVSGVGFRSLPIVIVGKFLTFGNGGVGGGGKIPGLFMPNKKKPPFSNPGGQKKHEGPPLMKGYRPTGCEPSLVLIAVLAVTVGSTDVCVTAPGS